MKSYIFWKHRLRKWKQKTIVIIMLKKEHENETPVHFGRYQNEYTDSNISIDKKKRHKLYFFFCRKSCQ